MFDHLGLPVSDLEQARRFYEQALQPLGIKVAKAYRDAVGLAAGVDRRARRRAAESARQIEEQARRDVVRQRRRCFSRRKATS